MVEMSSDEACGEIAARSSYKYTHLPFSRIPAPLLLRSTLLSYQRIPVYHGRLAITSNKPGMVRGLAYRILLTCINIFMPPLSVAMLAGFEWDCMINCLLFLCAVIPSHIHGFYISCTYFHRRRKVRFSSQPLFAQPALT